MEFKDVLKELRREKNLTHEQLAKAIGYSRAIIGFWESGQKQPTLSALIALRAYFNVTMDYLVGLEDESGRKSNLPKEN